MTFHVTLHDDPFTTVDLADDAAKSIASIATKRGAIATRFAVNGRELFFLDESTLADQAKNVRGGNPVLFPSPGKLKDDAWAREGHAGKMKQHGFARNLPWTVSGSSTGEGASVTLTLLSSDETRAMYPWDFRVDLRFTLKRSTLRVEPRVTNTGKTRMPFGFGFHPYFRVADKARARIPTKATRGFDNVKKVEGPFTGFDFTASEIDLYLLDHGRTDAELVLDGEGKIHVRGSADFVRWVVWTVAGKDYICLEPWTCRADALNTGEQLLYVDPGETRSMWIEIEAS